MHPNDLRTDAERRLWKAFPEGERLDLGTIDPTAEGFDPDEFTPDRRIRAEVISALLLEGRGAERGGPARLAVRGAHITGALDLNGGEIAAEIILRRCWFDEPIDMEDARIRRLFVSACRIPSLDANRLRTDGPLGLNSCRLGAIRLAGAHIGGTLDLGGSNITVHDRPALSAAGMVVELNMFCENGFTTSGEVKLPGAHIHGQISFNGATIRNPGGAALSGQRLTVDQDLFFRGGFTAQGGIRLQGAQISGTADFTGAELANPGGRAVTCERARIDTLVLLSTITGEVNLTNARLSTLSTLLDTPTRLNGLVYDDLDPDPEPPVAERIAWLRRSPQRYHPQPYEQLARYYRGLGHDRDARIVLLAKNRDRRRRLVWPRRTIGWLYDAIAGYGYVPLRALCWLIAAWATGTAVFIFQAVPIPSTDHVVNAALFSLDVLLPSSPFGLEEHFSPHGPGLAMSIALKALGWALSIAVLPTITRTLSRQNT
ncbi:hypothetical protein ABZU32_02770 [Sphaerisporangium sp. NPDC005288]|uniref:hypothetical protein n=1 Tax=Sphaerisporangium sp. NPDC005288 TaxID=3155114 RepID=UPI0033A35CC3